jgi:hypothetical protein
LLIRAGRYTCTEADLVTGSVKDFLLEDVIPSITNAFNSFLYVDSLGDQFVLPSSYNGYECQVTKRRG